jgi:hypothetical protein
LAVKKNIDINFDKNKVRKMEHTRKNHKKKQAKIFILSQLIDVSSISCTINYTNTSSLRELSLGVLICFYMDLIKSLNIFSFKTKVSTV